MGRKKKDNDIDQKSRVTGHFGSYKICKKCGHAFYGADTGKERDAYCLYPCVPEATNEG